jgi:hypothetical protein
LLPDLHHGSCINRSFCCAVTERDECPPLPAAVVGLSRLTNAFLDPLGDFLVARRDS